MSTLGIVLLAAAVAPPALLALAFGFMIVAAVISPTPDRQAMVARLGRATRDAGTVITGRNPPPALNANNDSRQHQEPRAAGQARRPDMPELPAP
jgi:hypothetical protein